MSNLKLEKKHKGFKPIRGPITIGGRLIMILIRPRDDSDLKTRPLVWNRQEDDDDR